MRNKGLSAALSAILAASFFVMAPLLGGCGILSINKPSDNGGDADSGEVTTAPENLDVVKGDYSTEVDLYLKDLSGTDYKGGAVKIVSCRNTLIMPDESTGTAISKDLEERNDAVENSLKVTIVSEQRSPDTMLDEINACTKSGTYYADVIMLPQNAIGAYAASGAIVNMESLPGFETGNAYLYPSAVAAGTGGDAIYAVAGHASLNADGLSCIFFNKTLADKTGLESPYDLCDRGEWTIDKYIEYMAALENIDGEYFGYGAQNTVTYLSDLFFFASGETMTQSVFGSYPTLTLGGEKTVSAIEKIKTATSSKSSSGNALTAIDTFTQGKTLFLVDRVDTMKSIAASGVDWGVLPLPKYSAEQKSYLSLAYYEDAMFFAVPPTAPNYGMSADIIESINIMSYGYTKDAYVENASYYYLRDNASIRMLSYVVENPVYDFAYSFADRYNAIPSATFMAVRNTVSGVSTLERYINMWSGQFNNSMYYLFDTDN